MSQPTPDAVLTLLREGNARFLTGRPIHPHCDIEQRREVALKGQKPVAAVLGCADSRVPPEILFDQGVGDLFVVRTAGQVVGDAVMASLEYAVLQLKVPVLLVLGHSRCGAVSAAVAGGEVPGHLPRLVARIAPAVQEVRKESPALADNELIDAVTQRHVDRMCQTILDECPHIRAAVESGATRIVGAFYDLHEGAVQFTV